MIAAADARGPFRDGLDAAERRACLRGLHATARLLAGPRAADLVHLLAQAETDPAALEPALHTLDGLAAADRRHELVSYAAPAR